MKILILCNTIYQFMVASCIRNMYYSAQVDLILSDHSVGHKRIYDNIIKKGFIFNNVFYVESKHLFEDDKKLTKVERRSVCKSDVTVTSKINIYPDYDMFFCANAEPMSWRLVNYLKRNNNKVKICWFEDGFSAYSYDKIYFQRSRLGKIKQNIKKIMGQYDVTGAVSEYYVFNPENMEWNPGCSIKRVSPMTDELIKKLGDLFEIDKCPDKYKEKYIFFEDGFADWDTCSDQMLVEELASAVGKENILVKIHPRNPQNRFAAAGFKTNKELSIPWEIIAANLDLSDKVLVTLYSQSVYTPSILTGKKCKCIILGKLDCNFDKVDKSLFSFMEKHFYSIDKDNCFVPESIDEYKNILKKQNTDTDIYV